MAEVHVVTPSRCADAVVDIIFVHGLGGDKVSTWQSLESEESFWPAWLGEDLQHAAIYSLGYDASPSEWLGHAMPLSDRAMNVLALLDAEQFGARPIVFICHSLGGLLIKQLLRTAATLGQPSWQRFARCTKSVVFLATPHAGARLANYAGLLGWVLRTSSAVQDLQANDAHLRELSLWYSNNAQSLNIVTHVFFETQDTKGVRIVDETSANPGISGAIPVPVDADHLSICKPANREALIYKSIRRLVSQYANPQPAPTESLDGTGTVTVADTPTAELTISSLAGRRRVRPLSGHPRVVGNQHSDTYLYRRRADLVHPRAQRRW